MSNSRRMLIAIIVLVIAIITITLSFILFINRGRIFYGVDEEMSEDYIPEKGIYRVTNRNDFFTVETCVNKFYLYYTSMYNIEDAEYMSAEDIEAEKKLNSDIVYEMLSKEYIEKRQITKSNIKGNFQEIKSSIISITDMYVNEFNQNMAVYIANGTLREKQSGKISNFELMLMIDGVNRTFEVIPEDYVKEKYADIKIGDTIDIKVPNSIAKSKFNMYDLRNVNDEEYVQNLINNLKEEMLYNQELAYSHLDEEYKNAKFESLDEFKNYSKNNSKRYVTMKIQKYQKYQKENYIEYICVDNEGRYYIFNEIAPMKCTFILDTFVIDLPEILEKYEESNNQEKVILNINKFMQALNDKDYKYAYNKLAESFKANKFKSQQEFEDYVKTNFFENNKFEYIKFRR